MGTHMTGTEASPARQPSSKWFPPIEQTLALYRTLFANHAYKRSLSQGAAFLAASLIAIVAAVSFATTNASNYVADLVLRNVGPYNMRFGFVYATFLLFAVTIALLAWRPNRLPFALKAIALFLVVRAVFVSLTHIAPSPIDPQKPAPFLNAMFYGSDQFFYAVPGRAVLLAHAAMALFLSRRHRVLRRGRAARALPLFDRRAGGAVHHPRHFPDRVLDVPTGLCAVQVVRARG
jgi:hypothetical protein